MTTLIGVPTAWDVLSYIGVAAVAAVLMLLCSTVAAEWLSVQLQAHADGVRSYREGRAATVGLMRMEAAKTPTTVCPAYGYDQQSKNIPRKTRDRADLKFFFVDEVKK